MFFGRKNGHEFPATAGIVAAVAFSHAYTEDTAIETAVKTKLSRHQGIEGRQRGRPDFIGMVALTRAVRYAGPHRGARPPSVAAPGDPDSIGTLMRPNAASLPQAGCIQPAFVRYQRRLANTHVLASRSMYGLTSVLRARSPVGEKGEEIGRADGA